VDNDLVDTREMRGEREDGTVGGPLKAMLDNHGNEVACALLCT
jgi:hypothetical protein